MLCPECYRPGSALPRRGPRSATLRSYSIAAPNGPLSLILPAPPPPQPIVVADNTLEYYIDEGVAPKCASNAVVRVIVQMLAPSSTRSSPNPFVRVQIVSTFSAHINAHNLFSVFQPTQRPQPPSFEKAACQPPLHPVFFAPSHALGCR